jgi:hypothetical protein
MNAYEKEIAALKVGNTRLLEALMDMCNQYLGNPCNHGYMSVAEGALEVLEEAGMAEFHGDSHYKLLWEKLEERKKGMG